MRILRARRGFWFTAGAAAGVYGVVKARRVAEAFTADGVRDRAGAASVGARMFREEFHQGRTHSEAGLRQRMRSRRPGTGSKRPGPDP